MGPRTSPVWEFGLVKRALQFGRPSIYFKGGTCCTASLHREPVAPQPLTHSFPILFGSRPAATFPQTAKHVHLVWAQPVYVFCAWLPYRRLTLRPLSQTPSARLTARELEGRPKDT